MIKEFYLFYGLITLLMLSGCMGEDGEPGKYYVKMDYNLSPPLSFTDDNPSTPDSIIYKRDFESEPGTYTFTYFVDANLYRYDDYEIIQNEGESGESFFTTGEDGSDTYLIIWCDPGGPTYERYEEKNGIFHHISENPTSDNESNRRED